MEKVKTETNENGKEYKEAFVLNESRLIFLCMILIVNVILTWDVMDQAVYQSKWVGMMSGMMMGVNFTILPFLAAIGFSKAEANRKNFVIGILSGICFLFLFSIVMWLCAPAPIKVIVFLSVAVTNFMDPFYCSLASIEIIACQEKEELDLDK